MASLKTLVIGMGVLIVIALSVVVITIINRAGDMKSNEAFPSLADKSVQEEVLGNLFDIKTFGDLSYPLPRGAQVKSITTGDGRMIIHLRLRDGSPKILVLDLATGQRLGSISLTKAGPGTAAATP